ncbi:MAG: SURF1 family protein [Chloroflexi bacterium]|nr:MAG: SURF1 family protein [Chloroflexota bacterium]
MHVLPRMSDLWAGRTKYLTVVVVILTVVLVRLGLWQYDRHLERSAINQRINTSLASQPLNLADLLALPAAEREYRPLTLTGSYEPNQVLWRNRAFKGGTGYHILSVLRTDDGQAVLVNRGWIPYEAGVGERWQTEFPVPTGSQTIAAVWRIDQEARENTPEASSTKWFTIDTGAIGSVLGVPLAAGFAQIQPTDDTERPATLPYPALTTDMGQGSHLGYTFQWFAFAVILVVGYLVVLGRRTHALLKHNQPL